MKLVYRFEFSVQESGYEPTYGWGRHPEEQKKWYETLDAVANELQYSVQDVEFVGKKGKLYCHPWQMVGKVYRRQDVDDLVRAFKKRYPETKLFIVTRSAR
jgi:hypothetical protein